eukprot:TRINITY_DN5953_c0_g1_i4.p1 TRINITY_DN5953_c0_g1~~TRINITY_DN5953_c0_g1_i4.p1  ORF type:complete len:358 (+),score=105.05 TRINITY_DN5953_c0_g1_i4:209-1282(+)
MIRSSLMLAACLALLLATTVLATKQNTSPLFAWSDASGSDNAIGILGNKFTTTTTVHEKEFKDMLKSIVMAGGTEVETVVFYLFDRLSSVETAIYASAYDPSSSSSSPLSPIRSLVEGATTSAQFPYVAAKSGQSVMTEVVQEFLQDNKKATVTVVRSEGSVTFMDLKADRVQFVAQEDVAVTLKQTDIFTNGHVDIVLVCLDDASARQSASNARRAVDDVCPTAAASKAREASVAANSALVSSFDLMVQERTSGLYISALTADLSTPVCEAPVPTNQYQSLEYFAVQAAASPTPLPANGQVYTSYFPPSILIIYVVCFTLFIIAFVGVMAVFSQQTPEHLTLYKPKRHGIEQPLMG